MDKALAPSDGLQTAFSGDTSIPVVRRFAIDHHCSAQVIISTTTMCQTWTEYGLTLPSKKADKVVAYDRKKLSINTTCVALRYKQLYHFCKRCAEHTLPI